MRAKSLNDVILTPFWRRDDATGPYKYIICNSFLYVFVIAKKCMLLDWKIMESDVFSEKYENM